MEKIWLKNYPKGIPQEIDPSAYNSILDLFYEAVSKYQDRSAYLNLGAKISFNQLDELSNQFACFLQHHCKLKKGDRIALQMPNLLQFPVALFGAIKAGLIVVNTNPLYTAREMKYQFNDSGAKAIVILANFAHSLNEIIDEVPIEHVIVTEIGDLLPWPQKNLINFVVKHVKKMVPSYKLPHAYNFNEALNLGKEQSLQVIDLSPEDTAFLQYTGGTTGVSKGAMLTHKNIISNMLQVGKWMAPKMETATETVVTALPLYHIFSLTVNCFCFMHIGATNLLITNPKDIPLFIKILKKNKFTCITGVNTLFNALMQHPDFTNLDFNPLKISVAGGMALQKPVALQWKRLTNTTIIEGFGLTETSPVACCNPIDGNDRVGTIGIPLPSTEVMVIDDSGHELGINEEGELCIKGPQVMKGYWNRPQETADIMLGDWLKTGDVAVINEDGFVKIVDRKKDMILVSGFNVFPNEIEEIVAELDAVLEVAAIGMPDEKSGEAVKLFVVLKPGTNLSKEQIIEHCRTELVAYKVPKNIVFKDELPKTNVGKILRRELR